MEKKTVTITRYEALILALLFIVCASVSLSSAFLYTKKSEQTNKDKLQICEKLVEEQKKEIRTLILCRELEEQFYDNPEIEFPEECNE